MGQTGLSQFGALTLKPPPTPVIASTISRSTILAILAAVYIFAGKTGLHFAIVSPSAAAIWAPAGIALGACLLCGRWVWPAIFAGAFIVNVTTAGSVATSLGIACGNTLEALIGAYLVTRYARGRLVFERTRDAGIFLIVAALLSTTISATLGVTSLCLGGYAGFTDYRWIWLTWWLGDASGDLLIAPLILLWGTNHRFGWSRGRRAEAVMLIALTIVSGGVVFGGWLPFSDMQYPLDFLCVPALLWAAFRFGPREAATVNLISAAIAVVGTLHGRGPFARGSRNEALLLLQAFAGLTQLMVIAVATEIAAHKRAEAEAERLLTSQKIARDEAEKALSMLRRLQIVTDATLAQDSLHDLMPALLKRLRTALYADAAALFLVSPDGQYLTPTASIGLEDLRDDPDLKIPLGQGLAGKLAISDGAIFDDLSELEELALFLRTQVKSLLGAPLRADRKLIGVIHVATRDFHKFTEDDLHLIRLIAGQAAFALQRIQLYESQRAAREAAEAADHAKDEFLAMLGHELRNPLQAIAMAVQVPGSREQINRGGTEKSRIIIARQVEHITRLVDDLLDVSRVTTGEIVLQRHPVNLAECAAACLQVLHETHQLDERKVETAFEAVWVNGDNDRLTQILSNLLNNAVKYTSAGAVIQMSVRAEAEDAVIGMKDTGIGIRSDLLSRVFDRFARGDVGLARSPGGLGIGLFMVKRLAELHDGSVEVRSDGPGRGSFFVVRLPRIAAPAALAKQMENQSSHSGTPRRVLIVEDNDDARESLRELLELRRHEVFEAADGPTGLETALRVRPDLALIDIGLPGFDGFEVARRLRSNLADSAMTLIAISGYAQSEHRRNAEAAGFDDYLVKPIDIEELSRCIASHS